MAGMHGVCTGHTQQDAGTSSQQILCFCCNLLLRCFLLFTGIPCHGHSSIMHRKCGESMVPKPLCPHQRTASCVLSWATPPHLEEMWVFISFHCFMPISFKTFYLTHPFSIPYFQGYQRDPLLKYNIPMSSINHSSLGRCILNSLSLPPLSCMSLFLTGLNPQLHDPCSTLVWDFLSWLSALPFTSHSLPSPPNLAHCLPAWLVLQEDTFTLHSCTVPLRFLPSRLPWYSQASWFLLLVSSALLFEEFPAPAPWNRIAVRVLSSGTDPWEPPRFNWSWPNPDSEWWFPHLWGINFQISIACFNRMESPHCQP